MKTLLIQSESEIDLELISDLAQKKGAKHILIDDIVLQEYLEDLSILNKNSLNLVNNTLEKERQKEFINEFKPMSLEEFKMRIDNSIDDYNNDRLIDIEDLEKEIEKWV